MDAFPLLRSRRLVLRPLNDADAADVYALLSDPRVAQFRDEPLESLEDAGLLITRAAELFAAGVGICWGLAPPDSGRILGSCTIAWSPANRSAHLGYDLSPDFWGRGLMREAVQMVLGYAFETVTVNRVQATTRVDNARSISVLRSLGFQQEGVLREFAFARGRYHDMRCFSLLRGEWLERRSGTATTDRERGGARPRDGSLDPG